MNQEFIYHLFDEARFLALHLHKNVGHLTHFSAIYLMFNTNRLLVVEFIRSVDQ